MTYIIEVSHKDGYEHHILDEHDYGYHSLDDYDRDHHILDEMTMTMAPHS